MLMSQKAALSHQALAGFSVLIYFIVCVISVQSHSERDKYHHIVLRAVSLLREGARASIRAKTTNDATDAYSEASKAYIYVSAVGKLLDSKEIAKKCNVNIDELRNYTESKLTNARTALAEQCSKKTSASSQGYSTVKPSFLRN